MDLEKPPCVQLVELTKRHGSTLAVDGLSLEIKENEFFSILGPSGSGKTTTLRLIAGLLQPDSGDIFVNGLSMLELPPNQRLVNTVFQDYALFPHMTVWDNIAFGLRMQGASPSDITTRVEEVLDIVKLPGKAERLPSELSGGEQQRVALARALINRPAVILLDEPLGALDQQLRQAMQRELKMIQAQVGVTFICVTHHQSEALFLSDRIAVMNEGRVVQIGTPEELYAQPQSFFVAQFVGQSNTLEGEVKEGDDRHNLFHSLGVKPIHIPPISHEIVGVRAKMILRPEQMILSRESQCDQTENCLEVSIDQISYLGEEMQYVINVGPQVSWTVRGDPQPDRTARFHQGEKVFVRWKAQHGLIFPQ